MPAYSDLIIKNKGFRLNVCLNLEILSFLGNGLVSSKNHSHRQSLSSDNKELARDPSLSVRRPNQDFTNVDFRILSIYVES